MKNEQIIIIIILIIIIFYLLNNKENFQYNYPYYKTERLFKSPKWKQIKYPSFIYLPFNTKLNYIYLPDWNH